MLFSDLLDMQHRIIDDFERKLNSDLQGSGGSLAWED
jgi:hypothetical protein